jgi:hypothetical protein
MLIKRTGRHSWTIGRWNWSLRSALRINFVIAVWITILLGIALIWYFWPHGAPADPYLGRFSARRGAVTFGFYAVAFESLLWFVYFRNDENELAALAVGSVLLLTCIETWISNAVNDVHRTSHSGDVILVYLGLSHVAYAVERWFGKRRSLLDL